MNATLTPKRQRTHLNLPAPPTTDSIPEPIQALAMVQSPTMGKLLESGRNNLQEVIDRAEAERLKAFMAMIANKD